MEFDAVCFRLHLRHIRVMAVLLDLVEKLDWRWSTPTSRGGPLLVVLVQDDPHP